MDMIVQVAQQAFIDAGYQWQERIYNDGKPENCSVDFTDNKNPLYFHKNCIGDFGWGRFSREECWERALIWLRTQ